LGLSGTKNFDTPIGRLSIPVFTVGVASISADIIGSLEGTISVSGPGSVDVTTLRWDDWGPKSVIITVSNYAKGGGVNE